MFLTCCSPRGLEGHRELAVDLVEHRSGDADTAGVGQRLQPGSHVHAVAVDRAALLDHVAQIHTDAEQHAPVLGDGSLALGDARFGFAAAHSTASTTLANSTSAPSPVSLTIRPWCSAIWGSMKVSAQRLQARERPRLVGRHQPAVADHVRGQNRRELPIRAGSHWRHPPRN